MGHLGTFGVSERGPNLAGPTSNALGNTCVNVAADGTVPAKPCALSTAAAT
jgi:hypothetical protein